MGSGGFPNSMKSLFLIAPIHPHSRYVEVGSYALNRLKVQQCGVESSKILTSIYSDLNLNLVKIYTLVC